MMYGPEAFFSVNKVRLRIEKHYHMLLQILNLIKILQFFRFHLMSYLKKKCTG